MLRCGRSLFNAGREAQSSSRHVHALYVPSSLLFALINISININIHQHNTPKINPPTHTNITPPHTRPPTLTGYCCGQCSMNQLLTSGTSTARRVRPLRWLKGAGAHISAMPLAVVSL